MFVRIVNSFLSNVTTRLYKVGDKSGNKFMIEGKVPPHITIAAFQTKEESKVVEILGDKIKDIKDTIITWASIGIFKSSVIFLAPVLNKDLHDISVCVNKVLSLVDDIAISNFYLPFQWMPHTTIAKKLSREELMIAFQELEKNFTIFSGRITKIGLSRTNPYEDIIVWEL